MKIKTKNASYQQVLSIKKPEHRQPRRPSLLLAGIIRLISIPDLLSTRFRFTRSRMEEAGPGPYLILMNHSSFIDLKIAFRIFFPKRLSIVCTSDGFVGKNWLMRWLGCIPTQKFVTDVSLIGDMLHTLRKNRASILMYPEASYSFDGCPTPLPRKMGVLLKKLNVPVVTVMTDGAFLRDPLYNGLQKRKTTVSAHVHCLLTPEQIKNKSVRELDEILDEAFTFDNFAQQLENRVEIHEPFRADGLERILYRCANCGTEGEMKGHGTALTCGHCGKQWDMTVHGQLCAKDGATEFSHIPDWYRWQRECVRKEIETNTYCMDEDVEIGILADLNAIYMVGSGHLTHNCDGFLLTGCDGALEYRQGPLACYGLYADYFWYEIGDMICIGNNQRLYYCFPKGNSPVAKARIAAEEIYKLKKAGFQPQIS